MVGSGVFLTYSVITKEQSHLTNNLSWQDFIIISRSLGCVDSHFLRKASLCAVTQHPKQLLVRDHGKKENLTAHLIIHGVTDSGKLSYFSAARKMNWSDLSIRFSKIHMLK